MVDNTAQNATATMATDDIAGVHYQIIKQAYGALDSATLVTTTNRLPTATTIMDSAANPIDATPLNGDALPTGVWALRAASFGQVYNGMTWDRARGDIYGAFVQQVRDPGATFRGRVNTFRTVGIAGTAGQKLFTLHNASGSTKIVHLNHLTVDVAQTAARTVLPPIIRVSRITTLPTGGTVLTKASKDTALASNASIVALGATASDGGAATAITATATEMLSQEYAPRALTLVGYEQFDRADFLPNAQIVLRALEGILVELVYTAATQNPITDMWIASCDWYEV